MLTGQNGGSHLIFGRRSRQRDHPKPCSKEISSKTALFASCPMPSSVRRRTPTTYAGIHLRLTTLARSLSESEVHLFGLMRLAAQMILILLVARQNGRARITGQYGSTIGKSSYHWRLVKSAKENRHQHERRSLAKDVSGVNHRRPAAGGDLLGAAMLRDKRSI